MGKQLFGTDGVRGVAGEYPLDAATVHALGIALGDSVRKVRDDPEVVIGMDTRESSPWIARQVAGGLVSSGVRARFAGVTTTPGVAYLTRMHSFVAGVMISASHNPFRDNGIKVFSNSGYKLPDAEEHEIEREILALIERGVDAREAELPLDPGLDQHYISFLGSTVTRSLRGLSIAVDCGNGAASALAPELFEKLGARVFPICNQPDGRNINLGCGALDVNKLRDKVLETGAEIGVAFDGDADRAILVSHSGRIVNGDGVLLVVARSLHQHRRLAAADGQPNVVATVMSNLGLERALSALGIKMLRTPVGDKYVLEEMLRVGAVLGGEQSGHIIFRDHATTGDGILTALRVIDVMLEEGMGLDELTEGLELYPQRLVNVRVSKKRKLEELPEVVREINAAESAFGDKGRVLVRFSGTEPLARVMVEGPDDARVEEYAGRIAAAIEHELS
ncbi:MAG TPA: phosphoglucosamine mutase [Bryobacteraceae bacterium]|nr:phosphoglucosamine mutase [Bryobacteraceae bacterium]